ncbi:unnamed protein product, partial [Sphenostylis stenocarpa]
FELQGMSILMKQGSGPIIVGIGYDGGKVSLYEKRGPCVGGGEVGTTISSYHLIDVHGLHSAETTTEWPPHS